MALPHLCQGNLVFLQHLTCCVHAGALSLAKSGSSENSNTASGLGSGLGASLERPGTTQRSGGRVAMTVLRPQQPVAAMEQQQAATALPPLAMPQQAQGPQPGHERTSGRSLLGVKTVGCRKGRWYHWQEFADTCPLLATTSNLKSAGVSDCLCICLPICLL